MKRRVLFAASAFEDLTWWAQHDPKQHRRILDLLKDVDRTPFTGLGKPEPLRHELAGYWSRRIDLQNRLVYKVTGTEIMVIACRNHY